jgi:hypothetical protein
MIHKLIDVCTFDGTTIGKNGKLKKITYKKWLQKLIDGLNTYGGNWQNINQISKKWNNISADAVAYVNYNHNGTAIILFMFCKEYLSTVIIDSHNINEIPRYTNLEDITINECMFDMRLDNLEYDDQSNLLIYSGVLAIQC